MIVRELIDFLGLEVLTGDIGLDRQVDTGYTSDLLSDAIAGIDDNAVWITIQRHVNILGVAKLKDVPAIIIPKGLEIDNEVIGKARDEGIAVLRTSHTAFEISGMIYEVLKKR